MTINEYLQERLKLPYRQDEFEDIINILFKSLKDKLGVPNMELKIISTSAIFSETVELDSKIYVLWDMYQWEIVEKFLLSALLIEKGEDNLSYRIFKENIYAAVSVKLDFAPELSYVFARRYRELLDTEYEKIFILNGYNKLDLLYSKLITLSHEIVHISFKKDKSLLNMCQKDILWFCDILEKNMDSFFLKINDNKFILEIFNELRNSRDYYYEEIACDSLALMKCADLLIALDLKLSSNSRSANEMMEDILHLYNTIIKTLNSFNLWLKFWIGIAIQGNVKRSIEPRDLHRNGEMFHDADLKYRTREDISLIYHTLHCIDILELPMTFNPEHRYKLFYDNAISKIFSYILTKDNDWADIIVEYNILLKKKYNKQEILKERNVLLGIANMIN